MSNVLSRVTCTVHDAAGTITACVIIGPFLTIEAITSRAVNSCFLNIKRNNVQQNEISTKQSDSNSNYTKQSMLNLAELKLAEDHSSWWNASWLVFLLMGRPAGNHGALTMGSGKEVLDAERATTENEFGTYPAGAGFSH